MQTRPPYRRPPRLALAVLLAGVCLLAVVCDSNFILDSMYDAVKNPDPPAADPPGGVYADAQIVTLTCPTPGAAIWYTTDGSDPRDPANPRRAPYAGPFPVAVSPGTLVTAYATKGGGYDSGALLAAYCDALPAPPVADPPGGMYGLPQTVTLSAAAPGAVIWYTTDGTDPLDSPTRAPYADPLAAPVEPETVIKARAALGAGQTSELATFFYSKVPPPPPVPDPRQGEYLTEDQWVTLTCPAAVESIWYTTDNTDPRASPTRRRYAGTFSVLVSPGTVLKAYATKGAGLDSDVTETAYTAWGLDAADVFVPVAVITGVPAEAGYRDAVTLTERAVVWPLNAARRNIAWRVADPGTTGAALDAAGTTLTFTAEGKVTIAAVIARGLSDTEDYTQDFDLRVTAGGYTITWLNWDLSTLYEQTGAAPGETPEYPAGYARPTRSDDAGHYDYVFQGWTPPVAPAAGDAVYTAVFEGVTRTTLTNRITLQYEDGATLDTNLTVTYGAAYTLPAPTWTGSVFGGWLYDDDNGVTAIYAAGEHVWDGSKDIVLRARWLHEYNVYYDAGDVEGVTGLPSPHLDLGYRETIALAATKPVRTGYVFTGWNTRPDGSGDAYQPGAAYTVTPTGDSAYQDFWLYAQWVLVECEVRFDPGGTGETTVTGVLSHQRPGDDVDLSAYVSLCTDTPAAPPALAASSAYQSRTVARGIGARSFEQTDDTNASDPNASKLRYVLAWDVAYTDLADSDFDYTDFECSIPQGTSSWRVPAGIATPTRITLTARWELQMYTIKLYNYGPEYSATTITWPYSVTYTLPDPMVVSTWLDAHEFNGWSTDPECTAILKGRSIEMVDNDGNPPPTTFYARWEDKPSGSESTTPG